MTLKIAVLLSGSGSTLQNIIDHIEKKTLDAQIVCVASSRSDAYGLVRAEDHGIPARAFPRKQYEDLGKFNADIWQFICGHNAELVVLAGFMSLLEIPPDFENRIVNVHPGLIPAFCGKGMYGHHVHEAVLKYGAKITGVTVHFVDPLYDHGPIIMQDTVPVREDDTLDSLAERVMAKEREIYPKAIQLISEGRIQVEGRIVRIK